MADEGKAKNAPTEGAAGSGQGPSDDGKGQAGAGSAGAGSAPATWTEWLANVDTDGAGAALFAKEVSGLKVVLEDQKAKNRTLSEQLRSAAQGAEGETKAKLTALADERDAAVRRADFYALAASAGCTNIDAAYHIAVGEDAFTKDGSPNIEAVRVKAPELFGGGMPGTGATKAGQGAGGKSNASPSMNILIRRAAGQRV